MEIRKLTSKEKGKHANMEYAIDFGGNIQFFTEKALREIQYKLNSFFAPIDRDSWKINTDIKTEEEFHKQHPLTVDQAFSAPEYTPLECDHQFRKSMVPFHGDRRKECVLCGFETTD